MIKILAFSVIFLGAVAAFGQTHHKDTVTHAVVHASHWVNHHVSAPHIKHHHYPNRYHRHDKSVHHAVMHAGHWISSHVNAPHKH